MNFWQENNWIHWIHYIQKKWETAVKRITNLFQFSEINKRRKYHKSDHLGSNEKILQISKKNYFSLKTQNNKKYFYLISYSKKYDWYN